MLAKINTINKNNEIIRFMFSSSSQHSHWSAGRRTRPPSPQSSHIQNWPRSQGGTHSGRKGKQVRELCRSVLMQTIRYCSGTGHYVKHCVQGTVNSQTIYSIQLITYLYCRTVRCTPWFEANERKCVSDVKRLSVQFISPVRFPDEVSSDGNIFLGEFYTRKKCLFGCIVEKTAEGFGCLPPFMPVKVRWCRCI